MHPRLVEEFMLLANMAVAHRIHRAFPDQALLRRHPPPQSKMLNDLVEFCEQMGLRVDVGSAGALNVSARTRAAGGGEDSLDGRSIASPSQSWGQRCRDRLMGSRLPLLHPTPASPYPRPLLDRTSHPFLGFVSRKV